MTVNMEQYSGDISNCLIDIRQRIYLFEDNHPIPAHIIHKIILSSSMIYFDRYEEKIQKALTAEVQHIIDTELSQTDSVSFSISDIQQNHIDWLPEAKKDLSIKWDHTNEYFKLLAKNGLKTDSIIKIKHESSDILSLIEDPRRPGAWDNRGLVVGDVQAGKTSNYIAVLAKAIDIGYKNIVVLAGMTNDLRKQTQERIDLGLLGYVSEKKLKHGVIQKGFKGRAIQSRTDSDPHGDFKIGASTGFINFNGEDCNLFVLKKNVSILTNLLKELMSFRQLHCNNELISSPLILIDDEADSASINGKQVVYDPFTSKPVSPQEVDPSAVNKKIRAILSCFSRSAYIGYTATPYANIFGVPSIELEKKTANKDGSVELVGEDLFPRNYIYRLMPPKNYYGPERVFGLDDNSSDRMPIVLEMDKLFPEDFVKEESKKKKTFILQPNPKSLQYAIDCFVLAATIRELRGLKNKHNSMLVHVDRLTAKHEDLFDWTEKYVKSIQELFQIGTQEQQRVFFEKIKKTWTDEFKEKSERIKKLTDDDGLIAIPWDEIQKNIPSTIKKIVVLIVNGKNPQSVLEYSKYPEGRTVIAVGGDKLARGLTLEGLSISYFLRASKMYDSLAQMGRWFGFRDGYIDVCRLMSITTIIKDFEEIAIAEHALKADFDYLHSLPNSTPKDFGLRVLTNPESTMLVCALNKARNVTKTLVSFSDRPASTVYIPKDKKARESNYKVLVKLLSSLPDKHKHTGSSIRSTAGKSYYWTDIETKTIVDLFLKQGYILDKTASTFSLKEILEYLDKMQKKYGEITKWTVALISGEGETTSVNGLEVKSSKRSLEIIDEDATYYEINRRRLPSGVDEAFDLSQSQFTKALVQTNQNRKSKGEEETNTPSPHFIRAAREKSNALLLLYLLKLNYEEKEIPDLYPAFMISFPESKHKDTYVKAWNNIVETKNKRNEE